MPSVFIAPDFGVAYQSFTNGGAPNAAGFIDTFQAGTTTVTSVYTTSLGTVAHSNPIVLDSAGRLPAGGQMWFLGGVAMKLVVKDSTSSAIQTIDNIYGINDPTSIYNLGPNGATVSSAINMNGAPINEAQGANIAIVGSVNLTTATGNYLHFTGTGTMTSATLQQGAYREIVADSTQAYANSTSFKMLGGASVTVAPGDVLGFRGDAGGVVQNVLLQGKLSMAQYGPQTANSVLAGPSTGPVAFATFRSLSLSDLSLPSQTNSLSGDVQLTSVSTFFDGPTVTQGTVGTWVASGSVTVKNVGVAGNYIVKLHDGTSVLASTVFNSAGISGTGAPVALSGVITNPAGNLRISVKDIVSVSNSMVANLSGLSKDSTITVYRIA